MHTVLFVDANVDEGLKLCREVKQTPELDVHTVYFYFDRNKKEVIPWAPYVNQVYTKGSITQKKL